MALRAPWRSSSPGTDAARSSLDARGRSLMSDNNPKWQVAGLDEIERRGRDIPVREHLGIQAFGINAYTPDEDGRLISEHDEAGSGQEELYIVLDGTATFEVDGETVDAPAGTFVFVRPESRRTGVLSPPFREQASRDDDFVAVRHDPRFEEALR